MRRIAAVLVLLLAPVAANGEERPVPLKDGPGRDLVETGCAACHSLDYIPMNSPFLDRKGWQAEVDKMVNVMGAPVEAKDVPAIVDYLVAQYGPVAASR